MAYSIRLPDGTLVENIPDSLDPYEAKRQIIAAFPQFAPETTIGGQIKEGFKGLVPGAIGLLESAVTGASALLPEEAEQAVRGKTKELAAAARKPFEAALGYEDTVARKLSEAVGSTIPFLAAGPLGLAGRIGAIGLGVGAGAGEARTRAEAGGATEEERATATALGIAPGALEVFAPFRILSRIPDAAVADGVQMVKRALVAGGEEAAQEAASGFAQNLIAKGIYKPEQELIEGLGEQAAYGGATGAIVQGVLDLAIGRRARGAAPAQEPPAPVEPQTEQERLALGYSPLAGTPIVFPDGTVALTGEQELARRYMEQGAPGVPPAATQADMFESELISERFRRRFDDTTPGATGMEGTDIGPEAPVEFSPTITEGMLAGTGLRKQSPFYNRLLGKSFVDPKDQAEIGETLFEMRQNPNIRENTKNSIENIAMQGFGAASQQGELFGKRRVKGELRPTAEALRTGAPQPEAEPEVAEAPVQEEMFAEEVMPVAEGTRPVTEADFSAMGVASSNKKLREAILGKDLNDPVQVAEVRDALEDFANSPNRSAKLRDSVEQFLSQPFFAQGEPDVEPAGEPDVRANEPSVRPPSAPSAVAEGTGKPVRRRIVLPEQDVGEPVAGEAGKQSALAERALGNYFLEGKSLPKAFELLGYDLYAGTNKKKAKAAFDSLTPEQQDAVNQETNKFKQQEESAKKFLTKDRTRQLAERGIKYRVAEAGVTGNTKKVVEAYVKKITEKWANAPKISVVQSITDLPNSLQEQIAKAGVNPKGVFDPSTETVFVVADNAANGSDILVTVAHESIGHFGLRSVLGSQYTSTMNDLYSNNFEIRRIADRKIAEGLGKVTAVEEVLAEIVEGRVAPTGLLTSAINRIKNLIRAFARKIGVGTLTDPQVNELLDAARGYVVDGGGTRAEGVAGSPEAVFKKGAKPTPTPQGQAALNTLDALGREVTPPPAGYVKQVQDSIKTAADNPKVTAEAARSAFKRWTDQIQTWAFSSDAALNNAIRRGVMNSMKGQEEKIGTMLNISLSQTVHDDALGNLFLMKGNLKYDPTTHKYVAVEDPNNLVKLAGEIKDIANKYGLTQEQAELVGHTAFEAKRLRSLQGYNAEVQRDVDALRAKNRTAAADRRQEDLKFIHLTNEEIDAGLKLFDTIPELNNLVNTWNGMRNNTRELLVTSGLWTPEEAERYLDNADYVPFFREDQLEGGKGPKEFLQGLEVQAKERKLKGGARPVNDVFDNMARWTQYAVKRSVRNRSANAMIDAALDVGIAKKVAGPTREGNTVRVWRDGEQEFYDMADPMFMDAFKGLESVAIPSVKYFSKLANILRQSVVLYPLFSVGQVTQDSFAAMFSSGLRPRFALTIPARAVKEFIKTVRNKSSTHEELKQYGAVGVKDFSAAAARMDAEVLSGLRSQPGILNKVKDKLEHFSMASDNAVRQAVYEASLAQGLPKAQALEKAFELINFRRRGSSKALALASQVIPFFNAYLAAQNVVYKTITGVGISPSDRAEALKTFATMSGIVASMAFIYAAMNGGDDDYEDKPTVIRDRLLMIPGTGLSVPLRTDMFLMPKIIAEHTYHMLTDEGMQDGRKFRDSMSSALANAFLSPTVVPQAIKPLFEVGINYSFFQGRPLIGTYQKNLEVGRQFNDSTSELAKMFADLGVSPIAADHLIRGMFGSVGGLASYLSNAMLTSDPSVERPSLSPRDLIATLPGTSGFVTREYETALKNDFYVLREEVAKAANTFRDIERRSPEQAEEYLQDIKKMTRVDMEKEINKVVRDLGEIRREISIITNMTSADIGADEKRELIAELREMEKEYLKSLDIKALREMAGL